MIYMISHGFMGYIYIHKWIYMGFIYIYIHDGILHGYYMLLFRNNFTEAAVAARVERLQSDLQRQERRRKMWDTQQALRMCLKMVYVYPELNIL